MRFSADKCIFDFLLRMTKSLAFTTTPLRKATLWRSSRSFLVSRATWMLRSSVPKENASLIQCCSSKVIESHMLKIHINNDNLKIGWLYKMIMYFQYSHYGYSLGLCAQNLWFQFILTVPSTHSVYY